jgi:hypothetical protein
MTVAIVLATLHRLTMNARDQFIVGFGARLCCRHNRFCRGLRPGMTMMPLQHTAVAAGRQHQKRDDNRCFQWWVINDGAETSRCRRLPYSSGN